MFTLALLFPNEDMPNVLHSWVHFYQRLHNHPFHTFDWFVPTNRGTVAPHAESILVGQLMLKPRKRSGWDHIVRCFNSKPHLGPCVIVNTQVSVNDA